MFEICVLPDLDCVFFFKEEESKEMTRFGNLHTHTKKVVHLEIKSTIPPGHIAMYIIVNEIFGVIRES